MNSDFCSCSCLPPSLSLHFPLLPPSYLLLAAVDARITSVVSRYRSRLSHYDVNNEMLHGGYFHRRGGPSLVVRAFQLAASIDPSALLFLNDFHVVGGLSAASRPEVYADSAVALMRAGECVLGRADESR